MITLQKNDSDTNALRSGEVSIRVTPQNFVDDSLFVNLFNSKRSAESMVKNYGM